jgi:membrane-associated phospholipid phosphatase
LANRTLLLLCVLVSGCAGVRTFSADRASADAGAALSLVSLSKPAPSPLAGHDAASPQSEAPVASPTRPQPPDAAPAVDGPSVSTAPLPAETGGELAPPDLLDSRPPPDADAVGMELYLAPDFAPDFAADLAPDLAPDQVLAEPPAEAPPGRLSPVRNLLRNVLSDHVHYYSPNNLVALAGGVGLAAAMANTGADENFRHFYQENVRDVRTDEYFEAFHAPIILGDGKIMVPVFAGAAVAGYLLDGVPLGDGLGQWGRRSLRTVLVGGPPMLAMQYIVGASRPGETSAGSRWKPFQDINGVSGHSFMGAIPFLSAAKMTDNLLWKAAFYVASTLPGLSRVNDDRHYASQVILGWWMAYLAATAVDNTQRGPGQLAFFPMPISEGIGVGLQYRR